MTENSVSFSDVAIVTLNRIYYRIHFQGMNKGETVNRMKSTDLSEKVDNYDEKSYLL